MDLPEFQRRFAARVRDLRLERGLRQEDLEESGLSWKSIQKLEYGITDPKVSTLLKLCVAFDISLPDLVALGNTRRPALSVHKARPRRR